MKSLRKKVRFTWYGLMMATAFVLPFLSGCKKGNPIPTAKVTTVATGLMGPMGLETDPRGNIWVAETGTAMNDGKVVVITNNNSNTKGIHTFDAIINLSSIHNQFSQDVEGPAHLLFDNGFLYVLAGNFLYHINVSNFKPGDPPIDASKLPYENIGDFVRSNNIAPDSHPYNMIKGPDGALYIVDAGANAIIRRAGKGNYSLFATFPDFTIPMGNASATIQEVPTGIIFDGRNFLVSTLTGGPFPEGQAKIYKVSLAGKVSVYQTGFTELTDIADGSFLYGHAVLQFSTFAGSFNPNTGALILANGYLSKTIVSNLNMPSAMKQINDYSWYVSSLGDGSVLKISYK